jgi:hypothetical protein
MCEFCEWFGGLRGDERRGEERRGEERRGEESGFKRGLRYRGKG